MVGTTLAHYRIVAPLGEGGMGVVYVAEDTKLHRRVALKVLPADVAIDPERRQRFEREAQAVAALNHPHIVTVHSIEQSGDTHFLTMELVDGQTLGELIPRHGLPLDRILKIAIPLADAVAAAHQKGITHRDLKPANVMVTADGRVKVLDFGLAKLKEGPVDAGLATMAAGHITGEGKILGTVAYMSPEQAEGKAIDHRSDIFALGVLLYEMATGERPFKGDTTVSIISSIIKDTPRSVTDLNPSVPRDLARIVKHALAKDAEQRYQTAKDLRNELQELQQELASGEMAAPTASRPAPRRWLGVAAGITAAAGAMAVVAYLAWQARADRFAPPVDFAVMQLTSAPGVELFPVLAPDGKWFAYVSAPEGNTDIFLQAVGGQVALNLTKDSPVADTQPTFSSDGEQIAFRSARQGGGIFVMRRTGESARRITLEGFNPSWSPDAREIVYGAENATVNPRARSNYGTLRVVTVATGARREISVPDGVQPAWSPHGHRIAYWGMAKGSAQRDIWTIRPDGGGPVAVTNDPAVDWNPVWSPDGAHLYFISDRGGSMNLWRVPIDEASGQPRGAPQAVTTPAQTVAHLSFSADGRRATYAALTFAGNVYKAAFDPVAGRVQGEPSPVTSGTRVWSTLDASPDGEWLATWSSQQQEDIYIFRHDGTNIRQLTDDAFNDRNPRWSPDGTRIVFYSNRGGIYGIWTIRPDGSDLQPVTRHRADLLYPAWARDGKRMTAVDITGRQALVFDPNQPWDRQQPQQLPLPTESPLPFEPWDWSPDGDQLVGRHGPIPGNLYTYSFRTGRYAKVAEIATQPRWLSDGRRLLANRQGALVLIDVASGQARDVSTARPDALNSPALSRDNRQLFFIRSAQQGDVWMLTLK